jgi:CubicO group peptidase (beta-lactamase class C family)
MYRRAFIKNLGLTTAALGAVPSFPVELLGASASASASGSGSVGVGSAQRFLPRSSPESQGVSSEGILEFLKALANAKLELHSFMLLRHGHVVSECWWAPYRRTAVHSLYSLSKSFTSTAIGFAVAEGKLKLTDRVISFFPEQLPPMVSDNLAALTIANLLSMSVGHKTDSIAAVARNAEQPDWVKTFLSLPIEYTPGSVFLYDTGSSFMLSAILQKVMGQKVIDYLQPRLFDPLHIEQRTWEISPLGINTGGWGLSVTTETLAKFGQFYLQKGRWEGHQLLPAQWVSDATSFKIQQPATWNSGSDPANQAAYTASLADPVAALAKLKQSSDWYQGYAYQFWRCRHNAYRGDGAFGQLCVVMPDQDAVFVATAETGHMQEELSLVWDHILPAMRDTSLPRAAPMVSAQLKSELSAAVLPLPAGDLNQPIAARISGRKFAIDANDLGILSASMQFSGDACTFRVSNATAAFEVQCGLGKWQDGLTNLPGEPPGLLPNGGRDSRSIAVAAAGAWKDANTFQMLWRFYETPHRDTVTCSFEGDALQIEFLNSITEGLGPYRALRPETRPILKGTLTG